MTTPVTPAVSIPLPGIDIQRPARRGDGYRVTLGRFVGRGSTQDAAKADLARQIITTIESLNTAPAFARDDDGAVIAALDRPWGIDHYRVTDAGHRLVSTGTRDDRTPAEGLAAVPHYTLLPAQR